MSRRHLMRWFVPVIAAVVGAGVVNVAPAQAADGIDLCVTVGREAGFSGENLVIAVAVAMAESSCREKARNVNTNGSVDRGLWQINTVHDWVTDECAYNARCNAEAAFTISDSGTDWTPWVTYNSGSYRQFLDDARRAIGQPSPVRASRSVNGDNYDDAIGIDPNGVAWLYLTRAAGGFTSAIRLGGGWSAFDRVAIGDSNADGLADLFATKESELYYWHNNGDNSFATAVRVGVGWSAVDHFAVTDVNGDNKADILARDGGTMRLYIGSGRGGFASPTVAGTGWTAYPRHTAADADGDQDGDIWATTTEGDLYFWRRDGSGYAGGIQVGGGWNAFSQMTTMDMNADGKADIVAIRTSDGTLWQWLGTGEGTFRQGTSIGHGWGGWRLALY